MVVTVIWDIAYMLKLVLCEYSKFSNTYRHQFLTYLTEWRRFFTSATTPSNQQNQLLMVQVLYCISLLLEVFILAHYYGPPSTETPTTETTIVRCHKNSWIYLTSTYLLLVTFETNNNYSIQFDSKWTKNTIRKALVKIQQNSRGHACCCIEIKKNSYLGCEVLFTAGQMR